MKIELSPALIDACRRYNAMPSVNHGSIAALNLVVYIGERVAALVKNASADNGGKDPTQ